MLGSACARVPATPLTVTRWARTAFAFETETFAFPNEIRARHPDDPDLYAIRVFRMSYSWWL